MEWETELRSRQTSEGALSKQFWDSLRLPGSNRSFDWTHGPSGLIQVSGCWLISDFGEKPACLHFPTHFHILRPVPSAFQPVNTRTGNMWGAVCWATCKHTVGYFTYSWKSSLAGRCSRYSHFTSEKTDLGEVSEPGLIWPLKIVPAIWGLSFWLNFFSLTPFCSSSVSVPFLPVLYFSRSLWLIKSSISNDL